MKALQNITDIKEIGEGGFAKVYSATWIDGKSKFRKIDDGSWNISDPFPVKVALKKFKAHWDFCKVSPFTLKYYGITKDPEIGIRNRH
ncbi:16538_t:CDS:2 [Funneliformis mosseae]|uniref:16538_t:CDS:1 n=1 Tax=Funneliformis mosseae TaxID=27381 RepID=A0A9N9GVE6_FUNMO|nr:16538_t:CDS:2 [Funneliformis mosseae]